MKISIVTPSLNSEKYIYQNLESVHLQQKGDYEIEQIIIDGNSTDRTIAIIEAFKEKHNADIKLVQGKDKNMYDALNKGLKLISGDVWACLNTDDLYNPGTLKLIGEEFINHPEIDVIYGYPDRIDENGTFLHTLYLPKFDQDYFILKKDCILIFQPSAFFRKRVIDKVGYFDINYNYASDYDYFIRVSSKCKMKLIEKSLTQYRKHGDAITCSDKTRSLQIKEASLISDKYISEFGIRQKSLFIWNANFYYKQFAPNNTKHILKRIKTITTKDSWIRFLRSCIFN
ncbi:MAG: hypothetical protein PWQ63_288 [Methanolobus sp.]|nr:hypothetical protein [Methanolobus sp.]